MDAVSTRGLCFVDSLGRQRLFHGINLVHKGTPRPAGGKDYVAPWGEAEIARFAQWGFNLVRLGVIWDAAEPQPGVYDEDYLTRIGAMLDHCAAHGLYVMLDMHQDLYSALFSDGAPAWATLTKAPFDATALWSDAYLTSPAVQQAYDAFWANRPAPDGIGLRDHFAALWAHIAARFGEHPALLAYDLLNEPYPGSSGQLIFGALMAALAELRGAAIGQQVPLDEMVAAFNDPAAKLTAVAWLEDRAFYQALAGAAWEPAAAFEREVLDPFFAQVTAAIRSVTSRGIILRANGYFSNIGIPCAASPIQGPAGREPRQAYTPHGYDLVVDTDALALASNARVDVIFDAHRATQLALQVPVIVGEWGAFGHNPDILDHAEHLLSLFERYQWSDTYWCYQPGMETAPVVQVLRRSYPQAIAGDLLDYANDSATRSLTVHWREPLGCAAPSVIHLHAAPRTIEVSGEYELVESSLRIAPVGGERTLTVHF